MQNIIDKIKRLEFPKDQYIVLGGAVLEVYKIRPTQDLDILVTHKFFEELLVKHNLDNLFHERWKRRRLIWDDTEIYENLHWNLTGKLDLFIDILPHTNIIDGISFQSLEHLRDCKMNSERVKDVMDVELINNYFYDKFNSGH